MGWNTLDAPAGSELFHGVAAAARAYFVHSYAVTPNADLDGVAIVTTSTHERATFVAGAERGALAVTQFHPEKSGAVGAIILKNWVEHLRG
jgi:glutamine amidotransferase